MANDSSSNGNAVSPLLKTICGIQTNVTFADTAANTQRMLQWLEHEQVQGRTL